MLAFFAKAQNLEVAQRRSRAETSSRKVAHLRCHCQWSGSELLLVEGRARSPVQDVMGDLQRHLLKAAHYCTTNRMEIQSQARVSVLFGTFRGFRVRLP